ncbi:MAG: hypothetical protein KDA37_12340, partial [Planctomycetales bacterium]|nr:hypothetical protein [Planctomycetales bacterium]
PRLRIVLVVVLLLTAVLGANSVYLAGITLLEWFSGHAYQNFFYQYMFLAHLVLGLLLIVPFLVFSIPHMQITWKRKNRAVVRMGYFLFAVCLAVLVSGLLLIRIAPLEIRDEAVRRGLYWLHVISPLVVVWAYCLHRLGGPPIKWKAGLSYTVLVGVAAAAAIGMHQADPRSWYQVGSPEGVKYFEPSLSRTSTGKFISAEALDNNQYCQECHADAHAGWAQSAHRFSSFNNPAYLASIRGTREFSMEREGTVRRARWCAGCHDPVPFFSGAFDDPEYDDVHHPTAHSGITCTVCHAITNLNSVRGNGDYTIEEPLQYPFTYSDNKALQWINRQLIKAKPSFHKQTFLKPFHRETEFCSVCHKVHLPVALNDYKFLRGQNHYDPFLLSGVSGHGARSFYYPPKGHPNCNQCHMELKESDDFGAKRFADAKAPSIHDHLFVGGNTALPFWRKSDDAVKAQQDILHDCLRVDLFGIREDGQVDGQLTAPLRPQVPALRPGQAYLLETVIRTLTLGHLFTQGTVDSNEVWVDVTVTNNGKEIGRSGGMDDHGEVDRWSHFVNVFVLDREGNRINRRNAQDIFVPLYNHQIPPGAGQTVHYRLEVPEDATGEVTVEVKVQYRKFDQEYVDFIHNELNKDEKDLPVDAERFHEPLPITTLASDRITFPISSESTAATTAPAPEIPVWQRWNDYGIGLFLKGAAELRQAEHAFQQVEALGRYDGALNLARVYSMEGRLDEAVDALARASEFQDPAAPPWTLAFYSGLVNREQGHLAEAVENFRVVLTAPTAEMQQRGFDFRLDYEVLNMLGLTLFDQARRQARGGNPPRDLLEAAVAEFEKTLAIDPENVTAHYNLSLLHATLGNKAEADRHRALHLEYKLDDNARDHATQAARLRYPAANHAAEASVIYDLQRQPQG